MKVSFIIPIYKKSPEQLRRCLKDLFRQSYKSIEVICVFDGPDADLEAVVREFPKVSHAVVIEHGGACKARNEGAKLATGDLLSFWDADCYPEPEMTTMWIETFKRNPDCDFVYSGYKWTEKNQPGYESEPFDPWTLKKYNYIASMFPIKREKFLGWDESLDGLQDWDYWRRVVANGGKGRFIPGFGFWTDLPDENSISGKADKRIERIRRVREKHEDGRPDILIHGQTFRRDAIVIAKTLGADYFNNTGYWQTEDYKLIMTMGLHPWELMETSGVFQRVKAGTKKAIYWTGYDADTFAMAPYVQTKALMNAINKEIDKNYAVDDRVLMLLEDLGIKNAELLTFPREEGEPAKSLPKNFKVLAWADQNHLLHMQGIASAMPDVAFEIVKENTFYNVSDYSVVLQFTNARKLEGGSRNALMMGRYVISNVQEPFSGFVDTAGDVPKFKNEVIARIRELQAVEEINAEAQEYYLKESDPDIFRAKVKSLIVPILEAV